jgi:hypothetical protein
VRLKKIKEFNTFLLVCDKANFICSRIDQDFWSHAYRRSFISVPPVCPRRGKIIKILVVVILPQDPNIMFVMYNYSNSGLDEDNGGGQGFLAWGTHELDRHLAASGTVSGKELSGPRARRRRMSYGAICSRVGHSRFCRKETMEAPAPIVIACMTMFGLLLRFVFY